MLIKIKAHFIKNDPVEVWINPKYIMSIDPNYIRQGNYFNLRLTHITYEITEDTVNQLTKTFDSKLL